MSWGQISGKMAMWFVHDSITTTDLCISVASYFVTFSNFPPLIWVLYPNVTKYDASKIKGVNFENVTKYDATLLQKSALINAKTSQI